MRKHYSKFDIEKCWCDLKNKDKVNKINVSMQIWSKSIHGFRRYIAGKKLCRCKAMLKNKSDGEMPPPLLQLEGGGGGGTLLHLTCSEERTSQME